MRAMMDFHGDDMSASSTCVGVAALLLEGASAEFYVTAAVVNG
ncbi:MAG: hypothetical protein ABJ215_08730 [Alphaproteobacteria bacterium]